MSAATSSRTTEDAATLRAMCAAKREYLIQHVANLYANTNPTRLWNAILKYRERSANEADGSAGTEESIDGGTSTTAADSSSWDELYISYDGYRSMVYELLFGAAVAEEEMHAAKRRKAAKNINSHNNDDSSTPHRCKERAQTSVEPGPEDAATARHAPPCSPQRRREIYFAHPFLSPATFLAFARTAEGTVPVVPLYAFAAKRLLLFRLRVELELAATVVPPALLDYHTRVVGGGRLLRYRPSTSSPLSNCLTQEGMESFVKELVPHLRQVRDVPAWMLAYYLCHASRKFMFMCDGRNMGSVAIDVVMKSEVFSELLRLYESDAVDAVTTFPKGCTVEIAARHDGRRRGRPRSRSSSWNTNNTVNRRGARDEVASVPSAAASPANGRTREDGDKDGVGAANGDAHMTKMDDATDGAKGDTSDDDEEDEEEEEEHDEDDTIAAVVESFEGDGCELSDMYTVVLVEKGTTVRLRRDELYWSSSTEDHLPYDSLCIDNWFSMALMSRIYEHFTLLDADEDGVLTEQELRNYSDASFTPLAIQRVFECHVPHCGERHTMDYGTYLNFVVATEHAGTRPAMKYIWTILDLHNTHTYIELTTLYCFCKELSAELLSKQLMNVSAQSILSEIVDMINPAFEEHITFADIEHSGHQATVLPILLSCRNFYSYDCREQTAATAVEGYAAMGDK